MDLKQVIILRKDLNMRKGKMIAQGAHASLNAFMNALHGHQHDLARNWHENMATKICVGVPSEQELLAVYQRAKDANIPCSIITDAGKTEFNGVPTKTAVAIGPFRADEIDKITGTLTLL